MVAPTPSLSELIVAYNAGLISRTEFRRIVTLTLGADWWQDNIVRA